MEPTVRNVLAGLAESIAWAASISKSVVAVVENTACPAKEFIHPCRTVTIAAQSTARAVTMIAIETVVRDNSPTGKTGATRLAGEYRGEQANMKWSSQPVAALFNGYNRDSGYSKWPAL